MIAAPTFPISVAQKQPALAASIPFESSQLKGDKEPDIDLNFLGEYQGLLISTRDLREGKRISAGISTVAAKQRLCAEILRGKRKNVRSGDGEADHAYRQRTTGQHPRNVILPQGRDLQVLSIRRQPTI